MALLAGYMFSIYSGSCFLYRFRKLPVNPGDIHTLGLHIRITKCYKIPSWVI
jgi:hypothetical protein